MFKRILVPLLILLFLLAAAAAGYFYWQFNQLKADPQMAVDQEVDELVAEVGELIILPEGETPTVATVSDPELLSEQAFFANAKAGDRVLLYTTAKKAILYDPVAHKIVEVAPINIGDQATGQEPEVAGENTETPPVTPPPAPAPVPTPTPTPTP